MSVCSRSGKAMFSKTVIESNSAPLWKSIPNFLRTRYSSSSGRSVMSSSSTMTRPGVGRLEAEHVPQRDRLAGARAAEDHQHLAAVDLQARAAQDLLRAVGLVHVLELDERLARRGGGGRSCRAPTARRSVISGLGHQKMNRNSLVRKKSMIRTVIAPVTTVVVVARPTPSAPPLVRRPL